VSSTSTNTEYVFNLELYHNGITVEGTLAIPAASASTTHSHSSSWKH